MSDSHLVYNYGPGEQCGEESEKGDSGPCVKVEGHHEPIHEDTTGHRFYA